MFHYRKRDFAFSQLAGASRPADVEGIIENVRISMV